MKRKRTPFFYPPWWKRIGGLILVGGVIFAMFWLGYSGHLPLMIEKPATQTCQPMYVSDWRKLENEIVTALQAQGHHIRKNAVGEHCVAGFVNIAKVAQGLRRVVVRVTMMDQIG